MNTRILLICLFCWGVIPASGLFAGDDLIQHRDCPPVLSSQFQPTHSIESVVPFEPGYKSAEDWAALIDSVWGSPHTPAEQLAIWDAAWDRIDQAFAAFQGLDSSIWTDIYNQYYAEIAGGVSRGRLAAIVQHATLRLQEAHTFAADTYVSFTEPGPGVPILNFGMHGSNGYFGAGLTPLPDSSLLVYKVVDEHPLRLVPGDIVLGYDGRPWKELYPELLAAELPIGTMPWGSCDATHGHLLLMGAGSNWHLFDTIDVVKYATGDTVHLPTSLMTGATHTSLWATEQMDIPGIPQPNVHIDDLTTWGVMEGANIGYIYSIGWWPYTSKSAWVAEWKGILHSLKYVHNVGGIIIDIRTNFGACCDFAECFEDIFDSTFAVVQYYERCNDSDHFAMCPIAYDDMDSIYGDPSNEWTKPIALLTGPGAYSGGDLAALFLSYHPSVKIFGKPTNGAFTASTDYSPHPDFIQRVGRSNPTFAGAPDHFLSREQFPDPVAHPWVDYEHVWLTADAVAEGRDDVVEAAVAWIESLDGDLDGVLNDTDNCPDTANASQADGDEDGVGDVCDNCAHDYNPNQDDEDDDNIGDVCDYCCFPPTRGDINQSFVVDITDVSLLVDNQFLSLTPLVCDEEGDIDFSGMVDITDLSLLIDNQFLTLTPLPPCP